ncbi:ParB N-terminal domain-containing protein [Robinsoniella peoriensis]|uniref:ParB N-terminal domain-containing protein n=1 Tax=Robinsoniella peoriensis TaxID=180332 RepID=UPI0005C7DF27|nr:ParB N-terminal domain-containing protein [Robinsoniella peoriensis]
MLLDINKIKVSDRIRKDFGNIQELADDIKENGLINPPVVTPDTFELIAGERRLRAMQLLAYKQIEVRPMAVKDAEHALNLEISENETRKDFSKAERIDYARRLERVESLKAKDRQGSRTDIVENFPQCYDGKTRDMVAEKLGIGSGKQYEKEKFIVDNKESLTPDDFADWDEGKISTNKAFIKIKAEKERLESENKKLKETTSKISIFEQEISKNTEEQQRLKNRISELVQKSSKTTVVTHEIEVDRPETLSQIKALQDELKKKSTEYSKLYQKYIEENKLVAAAMGTSTNYQLISKCSAITLKMLNFVKEMAPYDYMAESFNEIPDATRIEYEKCIKSVKKWADRILDTINCESKIIDM